MLIAATVIAVVSIAFRPLIAAKADIEDHLKAEKPHVVLSIQIDQIAEDVKWIREHMEEHQ